MGDVVLNLFMNVHLACASPSPTQRAFRHAMSGVCKAAWDYYQTCDEFREMMNMSGVGRRCGRSIGVHLIMTNACLQGNVETVEMLLASKAVDPNQRVYIDGHTFLMLACDNGHVGCVRALIKHGAKVDTLDSDDNNAAWLAYRNGSAACLRELFFAGADPSSTNSAGHFMLNHAVAEGNEECVHTLLDANANVDQRDVHGWTPLLEACLYGRTNMVRALLRHNASIGHGRDYMEGTTALIMASKEGHYECVQELLLQGALLHGQPLGSFAYEEDRDCRRRTALIACCEEGHFLVAGILLGAGSDVRSVNDDGDDALYAACKHGHSHCAELLLSAGADPDHVPPERVKMEATPLMISVRNGHVSCVRVLLQSGASPDALALDESTALHFAVRMGCHDACLLLLRAGASVRLRDENGSTAFCLASRKLQRARLRAADRARIVRRQLRRHQTLDQARRARGRLIELRSITSMLRRAAEPWGCANHLTNCDLFPSSHCRRVSDLLFLGRQISSRFPAEQMSFFDAWVGHVLPHAIVRG